MIAMSIFCIQNVAALPDLGQIAPGQWKTKSTFQVSGLDLPDNSTNECLSDEDAKDIKKNIEKELAKNGCVIQNWQIKKATLTAKLKCKNEQFEAQGTLTGKVTEKNYDISGNAQGTVAGALPATAELSLKGEWTGPCKK